MKPGRTDVLRRVLVSLAVGIAVSAPVWPASGALAQPQTQTTAPTILRPPSSGSTDQPPKFRMYFTVLVIGVLMLGANAIPSKRGHQD